MKLSKLIPSSSGEVLMVALGVIALGSFALGVMGWPSWVPWSAEHRVPVLEAQVAAVKDDNLVATHQAGLDNDLAAATQSTLSARIEEQARAHAYVVQIEDTPDAATRQRLLLEFVCGGRLYAGDPACVPGDQPPGVPH